MDLAVQTEYGFGFPKGVAGGLYDLSAHDITTRQTVDENVKFGMGVVVGTTLGTDVELPDSTAAADDFEGVIVHNSVMVERTMDNKVVIEAGKTVGCLIYGRIWVQIEDEITPVYKDQVYLITSGDNAGLFTTQESEETKIALNAHFLGESDKGIANAMFMYEDKVASVTGGTGTNTEGGE